jgi:hypothetical protein
LKGVAKAIDDHSGACATLAKSLIDTGKAWKAAGESHKAMGDEFTKTLKGFTSGQQQDVDEDNEGDVAEDDEEKELDEEDEGEEKRRKRRKQDEEEEEPEAKRRKRGKQDEEEDQEAKALAAYRDELKRRALLLKYPSRTG